jgi:alpha-glucosidase
VFGGPAWTWDARRGQYYLHNFLSSQPNLNGRNPAVQDALLDVARFWLERGVDGFRLDAINFTMSDPQLRDNPPAPPTNAPRTRSFDFQLHIHNQSQPEIPAFLERVRALVDSYGDGFTVAEVGGEGAEREMKLFTAGTNRLHSAYGFNFLYAAELTPALVEDALGRWPAEEGMGWPSWAFENHDAPRAVSRWVAPEHRVPFARMKMLLLASMRGNIILYQGEELGLTQVDIPFDRLLDPEAIANWPLTLSRDGARTPMPWHGDRAHGGFSATEPWLPLGEDHAVLAIDRQQADPQSQLAFTRAVIALRNAHPALRAGEVRILTASGNLLALERLNGERLLCVFNMGAEPITYETPPGSWREMLATAPIARDAAGFTVPPYSGFVAAWQENDGDR